MHQNPLVSNHPNIDKTKIMTNTYDIDFVIDGKEIEVIDDYKYLGKIVSFKDGDEKEIDARIAAAWRSFWSLKKFLKGNFPLKHKKTLMDTCVLPTLSYGSQCWSLNDKLKERIAVAQKNMERSMMNIKRTDRISNDKIRKMSKINDQRCNDGY